MPRRYVIAIFFFLLALGAPSLQAQDLPAPTAEPYYEWQVDVPVKDARVVAPAYPDSLRTARAEAEFVVEFVVDTLGRVEEPSIRVLVQASPPAPAFVTAVRAALLASRYTPASRGGRKVRQIVQKPTVFRLTP